MPKDRKEYLRNYRRQWMRNRRLEFFTGKVCVLCSSSEKLELDHINPADKITHSIWSWTESRRLVEISKCQVLCKECHKAKTAKENSIRTKGRPLLRARKYSNEQVQKAFKMFYEEKIPARQIAKILNIPRGTVSAWIYDRTKLYYQEITDVFLDARHSIVMRPNY